MKFIVAGLVLMFGSLWGGAFVLDGNEEAWFHFPMFMTCCLLGAGGIFSFCAGLTILTE